METKTQLSGNTTYPFYGVHSDVSAGNRVDEQGQPLGGVVLGPGLSIQWDEETAHGAFVEDVIWAAIQRLQFLNGFSNLELDRSNAIIKLEEALQALKSRQLKEDMDKRTQKEKAAD